MLTLKGSSRLWASTGNCEADVTMQSDTKKYKILITTLLFSVGKIGVKRDLKEKDQESP